MDKFIKKINTSPLIRKRITAGDNSMHHFPKTFGVPLKKLLEREDMLNIPTVVNSICNFLILYGLETEGLFRINGNTKAVDTIKLLFEENDTPTMSNCADVHAVASVLKSFLRDIPDGLIPENITLQLFEVYSQNMNNIGNALDEFKLILRSLPDENFNLLKYLCQFLVQVVEKENLNKMDFKNLGIVFGPNIFKLNQGIEGFKMQTALNNIFTSFISNYNKIFKPILIQKDLTQSSGYGVDNQLSNDGHKSSPSLSGDFDLSSSNDNHIYPAPLPSVSSDLNKVISSCINNRLSVPIGSEDLEQTPLQPNATHSTTDLKIGRTSSLPHSISNVVTSQSLTQHTTHPTSSSHDFPTPNNTNDLSQDSLHKSSLPEPTAPPRSTCANTNPISSGVSKSNFTNNPNKKINKLSAASVTKNSRKPFLVQDSWNELMNPKDGMSEFNYSSNKSENTAIMDEMLPDWQAQSNMIDLDDLDGEDEIMNDNTKENNTASKQFVHRLSSSNVFADSNSDRLLHHERRSSVIQQDLLERITGLRNKLKEFEENFERQHGCRPQLERSGNTQVQEWLAELMHLKERLGEIQQHSSANFHQQKQQQHQQSDLSNKYDNQSSGDVGASNKTNAATANTGLSLKSHAKFSTNDNGSINNATSTGGANSVSSIPPDNSRSQRGQNVHHHNQPTNSSSSRPVSMPSQLGNVISNLENVDTQNLNVIQFLEHLNNALVSQRLKNARPTSLSEMSKEQYEEEKVDLQKCLLHFEKIYGRPRDHNIKEIMKPLYDRYRSVKRFIKSNEEGHVNNSLVDSTNNGPQSQHQSNSQQQTPTHFIGSSTRSRGLPNHQKEEAEVINSKMRKEMAAIDHSGSSGNKLWKSSGSFDGQPLNKQQTSIQSSNTMATGTAQSNSQPFTSSVVSLPDPSYSTTLTNLNSTLGNTTTSGIVSQPSASKPLNNNIKSRHHNSINNTTSNANILNATNSADNTATPGHSVQSSKSFNTTTVNDLIPFRSCNTMTKTDMVSEKELLLIEKRRLQKLLKDFEHGLERMTGRKVEKSDRDHMRPEYDRYKTIKCRLKILEKELER